MQRQVVELGTELLPLEPHNWFQWNVHFCVFLGKEEVGVQSPRAKL